MKKRAIQWAVLAVFAVAIVGVIREPLFWKRYVLAQAYGSTLPQSFYEPRELIAGSARPPAPREAPSAERLDAKTLEAAAAYAQEHNSQALLVTRNGYIVFEKYWHGSNLDTVTDSGALGRIVAALATGMAISGRKIGWPEEPIGSFIAEWRDDPRGAITIRNLLQLSSGLAPAGSTANPWGRGAREAYGTDAAAQYLQLPLVGIPGKTWVDQNVDPDILALVIERATGQRYAQYVSNALWKRIGAGDAWLWLDRPGGLAHAGCCFFARQGDWLRVAELLLKNGNYQGDEVLAPRWVLQMQESAKANPEYGSYLHLAARAGAGKGRYAAKDLFVVEGGGNRLWLVPSLQIAILRTGGILPDSGEWDDARIPNLIIRGASDYLPPAAGSGTDVSKIVPNH